MDAIPEAVIDDCLTQVLADLAAVGARMPSELTVLSDPVTHRRIWGLAPLRARFQSGTELGEHPRALDEQRGAG